MNEPQHTIVVEMTDETHFLLNLKSEQSERSVNDLAKEALRVGLIVIDAEDSGDVE